MPRISAVIPLSTVWHVMNLLNGAALPTCCLALCSQMWWPSEGHLHAWQGLIALAGDICCRTHGFKFLLGGRERLSINDCCSQPAGIPMRCVVAASSTPESSATPPCCPPPPLVHRTLVTDQSAALHCLPSSCLASKAANRKGWSRCYYRSCCCCCCVMSS